MSEQQIQAGWRIKLGFALFILSIAWPVLLPIMPLVGFSGSAIARQLGITNSAVESLLARSRRAFRGERELQLTRTEFDLLELLVFNAEIVLERDLILDRIWGLDFATSSNSIEVYIGYLRRKTEAEGEPRLIHTVRGVGFQYLRPADDEV